MYTTILLPLHTITVAYRFKSPEMPACWHARSVYTACQFGMTGADQGSLQGAGSHSVVSRDALGLSQQRPHTQTPHGHSVYCKMPWTRQQRGLAHPTMTISCPSLSCSMTGCQLQSDPLQAAASLACRSACPSVCQPKTHHLHMLPHTLALWAASLWASTPIAPLSRGEPRSGVSSLYDKLRT